MAIRTIGLNKLYEKVIYESNMEFFCDKKFYNTIKEYYKFSGDHKQDIKYVNEIFNLIYENDFDPLGHGGSVEVEPEVDNICVLSMSKGNAKLDWPYMSLPAGYTCPMATVCKNFAAKHGQKFSDGTSLKGGPEREFMCYAARQQAQYKNTNKAVFSNLTFLQEANKNGGVQAMSDLIYNSIKYHNFDKSKVFRIHEGGDFFSADYMKAWIDVAKRLPSMIFYTHTTSLNFWISLKSSIPKNMRLIASMDKNNEELIHKHGLRYAKVVYSVEEAKELRLKIDYDDSIAAFSDESFALLIHGQQPAGSDASKAVSKNRKDGIDKKLKQLHKANKGNRQKQMYK